MKKMTSISVKEKTWQELNRLKNAGDTMDDVISRVLEFYTEQTISDDTELISDDDFDKLLTDLVVDDNEFQQYLEKTRRSFQRNIID